MKNSSARKQEVHQRKVDWGTLIVGLAFTTFALYISYAIYWSQQQQADAAANFEPVLATILDSKISQTTQRDAATGGPVRIYQPRIQYEYTVSGDTYQSTRFSYLGPASQSQEDVQRIIDRYPPGSRQSAYYNPGNPAEAVLHKGKTSIDLKSGYFWVPFILVAAGLFVIFVGWKGWMRGWRQTPGVRH